MISIKNNNNSASGNSSQLSHSKKLVKNRNNAREISNLSLQSSLPRVGQKSTHMKTILEGNGESLGNNIDIF